MKDILILGGGKLSSKIIDVLVEDASENDWHIHVADAQPGVAESKTGSRDRTSAYFIDLENGDQLNQLVDLADIVISMLPPSMHNMVALSCLQNKKHFLNASYLTPELQKMDEEARSLELSFICEMGLDPGIDHMSAMEIIDDIKTKGGVVTSFRSHCGGLISPESDDSPWHYKISWNPRNIVMAGRDGATFLEQNQVAHLDYEDLFDPERIVEIPGMGPYAWYPNRDSTPYQQKYALEEVSTFIRTTLRHPDFCRGWNKIVEYKLTDETTIYDTTGMSIRKFVSEHFSTIGLPVPDRSTMDETVYKQLKWLGFDSEEIINRGQSSAADILQWMVETRLGLKPGDRDMIIMLHEIGYTLEGESKKINSCLVIKGKDSIHTAMAETVGLPLASAATHILNGNIRRRGVFIPIYADVYKQVLPDLEKQGISFTTSEE